MKPAGAPPGRLTLRIHPDPALRVWCRPVARTDRRMGIVAQGMLALMRVHGGIGLAAPQVGLDVRVIVADAGEGPICVANPELTALAAAEVATEGCLSLPGIRVPVERAATVEVRGLDPAGRRLHFEAHGLLARVLQHEVDHLDGILIIDRGPSARHERHRAPGGPGQTPL